MENTGLIFYENGHLANSGKSGGIQWFFFALVFNNANRPWAAWSSASEDTTAGAVIFLQWTLKL